MFLCVGTALKKMTPPALNIYCGWPAPSVASGFMLCVLGKCPYLKKMTIHLQIMSNKLIYCLFTYFITLEKSHVQLLSQIHVCNTIFGRYCWLVINGLSLLHT